MDCEMPSNLTNVEMWTFLSSFFHTYSSNVLYLFFPFKDGIKEGNNTKKDKIQEICIYCTLTIIFGDYSGSV